PSSTHSFVRRYFTAAGLRQQTLAVDSDTTIRYWASESLQGPNPPVLLIHGFGPHATWQWRHQVRPLSRHFPLVVPDLLFFGGSTTKWSELFQAETLVRFMDHLRIKNFYVVGTSYGGFVAYHVARMCGGRVPGAVIASSDVLKGEEDDMMLRERTGVGSAVELMLPRSTGTLRKLIGFAMYKPPRFLPEFALKDAIENLYSQNLKEKVELIKGITLGNKSEFQLTPLSQDVLIIWGDHDRIFPLDKAYKLKEKLGEKARLEIVKKTGHMPNTENPTRFNELLLNFFLNDSKSSI
ncbi:uncharacterized protein LOC109847914, partial [Asparagus officinalis]|uniref:uncharacterized protein LOC109847914 n=1 Tax=Asparagus officinalis TaxID=4686 RepID=UPI00098E75ED